MSNAALLRRLESIARDERSTTVLLIEHLAECDRRKSHLEAGYSCLHKYCMEVLHLSEHAAYHRIVAARCVRKFPVILKKLREGSVNLTTIKLLGPHLTGENHERLLAAAHHKTRWQVEKLVAQIQPLPAVPAAIRKLPGAGGFREEVGPAIDFGSGTGRELLGEPPGTGSVDPGPGSAQAPGDVRATGDAAVASCARQPEMDAQSSGRIPQPRPYVKPVEPLASEIYKVQFTVGADTCKKLRQVQELLRHQVPNGDPAVLFDMGLSLLLERLMKQKLGSGNRRRKLNRGKSEATHSVQNESSLPEVGSGEGTRFKGGPRGRNVSSGNARHVPVAVRQQVWDRDGGQCAFRSSQGKRCSERGNLEFHHVEPFARGGRATFRNIELRCRPHNAFEGEQIFGRRRRDVLRE